MPSHRIRRGALALLLCLLALAGGGWWALAAALPDTFYTTGSAQALRIASLPWVTVQETPAEVEQAGRTARDKSQNVTLALFGAVPLKTVRPSRCKNAACRYAARRLASRCSPTGRWSSHFRTSIPTLAPKTPPRRPA